MTHRLILLAAVAVIVPACAGCSGDIPTNPEAGAQAAPALTRMPGDPGDASDRLYYRVNLRPLGDSRAVASCSSTS